MEGLQKKLLKDGIFLKTFLNLFLINLAFAYHQVKFHKNT